ncbi:MAG: maleylpyruvate isomerase N-terminal domain-containing protein, partial [Propionicimonas sp.]
MTIVRSERAALVEALRSAGPAAATLCQGWDAHDLAVHVWLREHEFATALGVAGGPLAARLTRRMAQVRAERGFDDLVDVF